MGIKIGREQCDAIHAEILAELTGSGDVYAKITAEDYDGAKATRRRLEDATRLLDDLGWESRRARGGTRAHDALRRFLRGRFVY